MLALAVALQDEQSRRVPGRDRLLGDALRGKRIVVIRQENRLRESQIRTR